MRKIGLHEPYFIGNEKILAILHQDNWVSTSGKFTSLFEKKICKLTKSKFAVSFERNNRTSPKFNID